MFTPSMAREDPDIGYIAVINRGSTELLDGAPCGWHVLDTPPEDGFDSNAGVTRISSSPTKGSAIAGIVGPNPNNNGKIPVGHQGIIQVYGIRTDVKKQAENWTVGTVRVVADGTIDQDVCVDYPVSVGGGDYTVGNNVGSLLMDSPNTETECTVMITIGNM